MKGGSPMNDVIKLVLSDFAFALEVFQNQVRSLLGK